MSDTHKSPDLKQEASKIERVGRDLPPDLYRLMNHSSAVIVIDGKRGDGKTDFSLKLADGAFNDECISSMASNIETYDDPRFQHITNLPDLEYYLKWNKGRKLYIMDEAGQALPASRWMSSLNVKILGIIQLIRHFHARLIFIAPSKKFIDRHLQYTEIMDAHITKNNQQIATVKNYLTNDKYTLFDVQATSIRFSQVPTYFTLDKPLKLDKLNEWEKDLYAYAMEGKSFKKIAEETGRHPIQVKRVLVKFGKHYFEKLKH